MLLSRSPWHSCAVFDSRIKYSGLKSNIIRHGNFFSVIMDASPAYMFRHMYKALAKCINVPYYSYARSAKLELKFAEYCLPQK